MRNNSYNINIGPALPLICLSLLCTVAPGWSQTDMLKKQKKKIEVNIHTQDSSVKTELSPGKLIRHAKEDRFYYWCSNDKIFVTQGGSDGRLLNGSYSCFYLNGQLKEKGKFHKGLKNGLWVSWYGGGGIRNTGQWKRGARSGLYKEYNSAGEIVLLAHYRKNRLHGTCKKYEDGKVVSAIRYKNGVEALVNNKPEQDSISIKNQSAPAAKKSSTTIIQKIKNYFKNKKRKDPKPAEQKKREVAIKKSDK